MAMHDMERATCFLAIGLVVLIATALNPVPCSCSTAISSSNPELQMGMQHMPVPSRGEVIDAITAYMRATYLSEDVAHMNKSELRWLVSAYVYHGRYPRTVLTPAGVNITIYKPLERIVVLNTDVAEAIRALGAANRIIGISDTVARKRVFFPELCDRPVVGTWKEVDTEALLALNPDAVFTYVKVGPGPEYLEDKLPPSISVIRMDFYKPESTREEMLKLGELLDLNTSAYINWHDRYVEMIEERISELKERPKVFLDNSGVASTTERKTYSNKSGGISTLCELAGGENVASELEVAYPAVEVEWVMEKSPDVIIGLSRKGGYETDDASGMKDEYRRIMELPLKGVPAIYEERVHLIDGSLPFGPGYPVGLAYMAKWLHPDEFADLDPQAIHQEYIDEFCGIDFDVKRQGVFVYPE